MAHASVEHVGDGFEAAMRMVGETRQVILGLVGAELVEQQEGIQHVELRRADHARELDARAVGRRLAAQLARHAGVGRCVVVSMGTSCWEAGRLGRECGLASAAGWNAGFGLCVARGAACSYT
jgi:hypothetical protein